MTSDRGGALIPNRSGWWATDLVHGDELWRVDRGYLFADGFESADISACNSSSK